MNIHGDEKRWKPLLLKHVTESPQIATVWLERDAVMASLRTLDLEHIERNTGNERARMLLRTAFHVHEGLDLVGNR